MRDFTINVTISLDGDGNLKSSSLIPYLGFDRIDAIKFNTEISRAIHKAIIPIIEEYDLENDLPPAA